MTGGVTTESCSPPASIPGALPNVLRRLLHESVAALLGAKVIGLSLVQSPRRPLVHADARAAQVTVVNANGVLRDRAGVLRGHGPAPIHRQKEAPEDDQRNLS